MAKATPPKSKPKNAPDKGALVLDAVDRMRNGQSIRSIAKVYGMSFSALHERLTRELTPDQYARAREAQADAHADQACEVAIKALRASSSEEVAARRLLVDTLKWRAAKFHPNRYSDKQQLEHSGQIGLTVAYQREGRRG